jgi:hypothetical protein
MRATLRPEHPTFCALSGPSREFIQKGRSVSCQYIIVYVFKQTFCPIQWMICKHLRNADVLRDAAIPVLATNAETVDIADTADTGNTGNTHPHSEEYDVKKGKYKEQQSNMLNIRKINACWMPVNPAASEYRRAYTIAGTVMSG